MEAALTAALDSLGSKGHLRSRGLILTLVSGCYISNRRSMFADTPVIYEPTTDYASAFRAGLIFAGVSVTVLVSGSFCAWLAHVKGRPLGAWFLLGMVFGPFALIAIAGAPTVASREARWSSVVRGRQRRPRASQRPAATEASSLAAVQVGGMQRAGVRGRHEAAQTSPEHQELLDASRARRETLEQRRTRFDD